MTGQARNGALRVTLAQLPCKVGDLTGNRARILAAAQQGVADHADLLITPEMALTGYSVEDLAYSIDFAAAVHAELDALIHELPESITCAIGTLLDVSDLPDTAASRLESSLDSVDRHVANALVIVRDGRIVDIVIKSLLPTYGVFDDARWFAPARTASSPVTINGVSVGFAICEDAWGSKVIDQLARAGATVLVTANASPYADGKVDQRDQIAQDASATHGLAFVYCNMTGGQDEVVYDGQSFATDPAGRLLAALPAFTPAVATVDIPLPGAGNTGRAPISAPLAARPTSTDATYRALVTALGDYIDGAHSRGVIIGLSGGLDSALAAVIAVDALGADRVLGVRMPGPYSSQGSLDDAADLADRLGIDMVTLPVSDAYQLEKDTLGDLLTSGDGAAVADENIQARLRALHLMTLANAHGRIVLNTGNKSEASVGYFTLGGDSSGGFAILKDVYKTRAYELAHWRNELAEVLGQTPPIPASTLEKPPSAELAPDQVDTNSLPPYPVLDCILIEHIERQQPANAIAATITERFNTPDAAALVTRIITMVARSEHKRRQVAPGPKVTSRAYGRDRRMPIISAHLDA